MIPGINESDLIYDFDHNARNLRDKVSLPETKIRSYLRIFESNRYKTKNCLILEAITEKYENILAAIYDAFSPEEARLILNFGYFAGGCFASMFHQETVNDYDLYFSNRAVAHHFFEKFRNSESPTYVGKTYTIESSSVTDRAITLFVYMTGSTNHPIRLQLITKYVGTPEEVTSGFDFVHCMSYFKWDRGLVLQEEAISFRQLIFNKNAVTPLNSIMRIHKLCSRGWHIKGEEILKLGESISRLNFKDSELMNSISFYY